MANVPDTPTASGGGFAVGAPLFTSDKNAYFNGVQVALGPGDIMITLLCNNVPFLTLNTPLVTAKALGVALEQCVAMVDNATGQATLDFGSFVQAMSTLQPKPPK